ncbi:MAG: hypothetical protein AAGI28_00885 [Pseudomonadota bacterium]
MGASYHEFLKPAAQIFITAAAPNDCAENVDCCLALYAASLGAVLAMWSAAL